MIRLRFGKGACALAAGLMVVCVIIKVCGGGGGGGVGGVLAESSPPSSSSSSFVGEEDLLVGSAEDCARVKRDVVLCLDRLSKMSAELSQLKAINEESVRACNLVSEKQVESLEECQRSQEELGLRFNSIQAEKLELQAKVTIMSRDGIEKEAACGRRIEQVRTTSEKVQSADLQMKMDEIIHLKEHFKGMEDQYNLIIQNLQIANTQIDKLKQESFIQKEEFQTQKEQLENTCKVSLENLQNEKQKVLQQVKNLQNIYDELQQHHEKVQAKFIELQQQSSSSTTTTTTTSSSSQFYTWDQFQKNLYTVWIMGECVGTYLYTFLGMERLHPFYVAHRVQFMDPLLIKIQPYFNSISTTLRNLYNNYLHHLLVKGIHHTHNTLLPYWIQLQHKMDYINQNYINTWIQNLETDNPRLADIFPKLLLDRIFFCLSLTFFLYILLALTLTILRYLVLPLLDFFLCRILFCGLCNRRHGRRHRQSSHHRSSNNTLSDKSVTPGSTKKKNINPPPTIKTPGDINKRRPDISASRGALGTKTFKGAEDNTTTTHSATTTSSSTGGTNGTITTKKKT